MQDSISGRVEAASRDLRVQHTPIASLKAALRNPRTHTNKQIRQIADSIHRFGFTNPVLVDGEGWIIVGHGRVAASKLLGLQTVPTLCLEHMSEAEKRAYVLADNRLAELAGWDQELLALELQYLTEIDIDFDVTITGFEVAEIDLIIEGLNDGDEDAAADEIPEMDPDVRPVSRLGDLWCLGSHRLLCGDARDGGAYRRLMEGQLAQMVFTDPPYNVAIDGHVCGRGQIHHSEFVMASGEMTEEEFTEFLGTVFRHLADHSADGSLHYVCMDWRHAYEILTAARSVYSAFKNLCVWNKDNGGLGSFYRSKHELVFVFKNGSAPHINTVELGRYGRNRTNVWDYPGVNSLNADRRDDLRRHPTVKPVALVVDAIKDASKRTGVILDPFAGSGTILIAAEKTGRRAFAMELDPTYVDTAIRRWQQHTGKQAVHAETGLTFTDVTGKRAAGSADSDVVDGEVADV